MKNQIVPIHGEQDLPKGINRSRALPDPALGAQWDSIVMDDRLKKQRLANRIRWGQPSSPKSCDGAPLSELLYALQSVRIIRMRPTPDGYEHAFSHSCMAIFSASAAPFA
jgi:hypothetical protein